MSFTSLGWALSQEVGDLTIEKPINLHHHCVAYICIYHWIWTPLHCCTRVWCSMCLLFHVTAVLRSRMMPALVCDFWFCHYSPSVNLQQHSMKFPWWDSWISVGWSMAHRHHGDVMYSWVESPYDHKCSRPLHYSSPQRTRNVCCERWYYDEHHIDWPYHASRPFERLCRNKDSGLRIREVPNYAQHFIMVASYSITCKLHGWLLQQFWARLYHADEKCWCSWNEDGTKKHGFKSQGKGAATRKAHESVVQKAQKLSDREELVPTQASDAC